MTDKATLFSLVFDLEATGLDENLDDIIEVGAIGVDADYNVLFEYTKAVRPSQPSLNRLLTNDFVREMHTTTGLLSDIVDGAPAEPRQIEDDLIALIRQHRGDAKPVLSGSGVGHYDQRFLRRHMPTLLEEVHHRPNDVGSAREEFKRINGFDLVDANSKKTHRALDDARCHLEELRAFAAAYRTLGSLAVTRVRDLSVA